VTPSWPQLLAVLLLLLLLLAAAPACGGPYPIARYFDAAVFDGGVDAEEAP
jgi:hypothetical protein